MQKFLFLILPFIILGCETNPLTQPISLKTGEVKLEITLSEDGNINPERVVLLEDFANVSCVPCVTSNKIIRSVLQSYGSNKVQQTFLLLLIHFIFLQNPFVILGWHIIIYFLHLH
jgi:hypothetical protein